MAGREDFRGLSGQQKAAILMLSIGEDTAMRLFSLMDDDEIKELSQAMAGLGRIDADMVERLFVEFADQVSSTGSLHGSYESTERLLMKAMPADRVEGRVKASTLKKIAEIVERHPEETVGIIRQWMYAE